jgi:hypothetical protein
MVYPNITIMSRVSGFAEPSFSVEVRHDDEGDWETYFNDCDKEAGLKIIDHLLGQFPEYPLLFEGQEVPIKGYLYKIVRDNSVSRFFRTVDSVTNPFYNRKIYANANPDATVSFIGLNLD